MQLAFQPMHNSGREGRLVKRRRLPGRRCVTFDDPGLPQFWSKKAFGTRDSEYWRARVTEYLTFPNPINTTLPHWGRCVRIDLDAHNTCAGPSSQCP